MGCSASPESKGNSTSTNGECNMDAKVEVLSPSQSTAPMRDNHEIRDWLEKLRLTEYIINFVNNGYDDLNLIEKMQREDLARIGIIKIGHQASILAAIKKKREQTDIGMTMDPCFTLNSSLDSDESEHILIPSWQCSSCKNQNGVQLSECQLCGQKAATADVSKLPLIYPKNTFVYQANCKGKWRCPQCQNMNGESDALCLKCDSGFNSSSGTNRFHKVSVNV